MYGVSSNGLRFRHLDGTTSENLDGDLYLNYNNYSRPVRIGNQGYMIYNNGANYSGTAQKAIQDSNGNQISSSYLPLSGGLMTGNIYRSTDDGYIVICGGMEWDSGGSIILSGKNCDASAGKVTLQARSDAGVNIVEITPDVGVVPTSYNAQGISLGTSSNKWKAINGFDVTGIGHISNRQIDQSGDVKTYTRNNPNVGNYAHYCVAPDNGWVACREHNGSGTFQVCALGSDLNGDPIIISPKLNQFQFGSVPVRKGEYYAIISDNASAAYTMRFVYNNG